MSDLAGVGAFERFELLLFLFLIISLIVYICALVSVLGAEGKTCIVAKLKSVDATSETFVRFPRAVTDSGEFGGIQTYGWDVLKYSGSGMELLVITLVIGLVLMLF